jgi:hypothetical protein
VSGRRVPAALAAAVLALAAATVVALVVAFRSGDDAADAPPAGTPVVAAAPVRRAASPASRAAGTSVDVDDAPIPGGATLTIRGTVTDDAGAAITGADVVANPNSPPWSEARAKTDAAGAYALENLDPLRTWSVAAWDERFGYLLSARTVVATGRRLDVRCDFVLPRRGGIALTVKGADGKPLAHESWAVPLDREDQPTQWFDHGLQPGRWRLVVASRGHATEARTVTVGPGETVRADVRLGDDCELSGALLASDGTPMKGFQLVASDPEISDRLAWHSAATGDDGGFRFSGLRATAYTLRVHDEDLALDGAAGVAAPASGVRLTVREDVRATWRIVYPADFDAGDRATEVSVTLSGGDGSARRLAAHWDGDAGSASFSPPDGAALTFDVPGCVKVTKPVRVRPGESIDLGDVAPERAYQIGGRVADGSGRPIGNANLAARVGDTNVSGGSAADGTFCVAPLPTGDGTLDVTADGFARARVAIRGGQTERVFVTLCRGGRLALRGAAPGAKVRFVGANGDAFDEAADGFGEKLTVLAAGRWRVESAGAEPVAAEVREGATTTVRLAPAAR